MGFGADCDVGATSPPPNACAITEPACRIGKLVVLRSSARQPQSMIVTHAQNARGQRRVYLGGKASLECWIEPTGDGQTWRFHIAAAVTGNAISPADQRQWAIHILMQLAETLNIAPQELASVPFEAIAGLHTGDPFAGRRIATPRRTQPDQAFMSTAPDIRRPARDFDGPTPSRAPHR